MTQPTTAGPPAINLSPREKLEILGAILLALFLFALDQTVVGTALPKIITDLKGNELYTWSVTIYLLTSTISGPIYGKLSDLFGRRPIVIFAVGLFLVSSVLAGLSQTMWQFILFRGLQGLGGGAVFPIALAVIADLYPPEERAKYGAFFGAIAAANRPAPMKSMSWPLSGCRIGGSSRQQTNSETAATGTLTKKIQCQLNWSVMIPPMAGPTSDETPKTAPNRPRYLPRSAGV